MTYEAGFHAEVSRVETNNMAYIECIQRLAQEIKVIFLAKRPENVYHWIKSPELIQKVHNSMQITEPHI